MPKTLKKPKRKNFRSRKNSNTKRIKPRKYRSIKHKSKKIKSKKVFFQKGGDNTYEMLRLVCGDLKPNPTYGLNEAARNMKGVYLASNLGITKELGEVGEAASGYARFLSPSKTSEIFKKKIKNLIRGEILMEADGWKDRNGYSCKYWTPAKCQDKSRGSMIQKIYSEKDMNEVRDNCKIACGYGNDKSKMLREGVISLNKRKDYVKPDINFSGSPIDWPQVINKSMVEAAKADMDLATAVRADSVSAVEESGVGNSDVVEPRGYSASPAPAPALASALPHGFGKSTGPTSFAIPVTASPAPGPSAPLASALADIPVARAPPASALASALPHGFGKSTGPTSFAIPVTASASASRSDRRIGPTSFGGGVVNQSGGADDLEPEPQPPLTDPTDVIKGRAETGEVGKLGPAVYLCVYIGDPNRGGTQSTTGWYNSDYVYTSILVSDKENNCKEYNLKYEKPFCEGNNLNDDEKTCNTKQMLKHRQWVLEEMRISGYDNKGHNSLQDIPQGGHTGTNGVNGYLIRDLCTAPKTRSYKAPETRTDRNGRQYRSPGHSAACWPPERAGTSCGKPISTGLHPLYDKKCKKQNVTPSGGSHLEDKRPDENPSGNSSFGLCKYCRASGINMTVSSPRNIYDNTETRDTTDHFSVIGHKPKFRFAIFMGHADKEIRDLGERASNRVNETDRKRKNAKTGQLKPLFRAELIRGRAGDDLCSKFCMEMMKELNIRCINPGRTEEQGIVESWKKMNEPDFIQCYKILSYIVENKSAWTDGAFGRPERTHIEYHLPNLCNYIKAIDELGGLLASDDVAKISDALRKHDGKPGDCRPAWLALQGRLKILREERARAGR
jgi:hypothetical protein